MFKKNSRRRGASTVEYGLVVALVGVAAITSASTLGDEVDEMFGNASSEVRAVSSTMPMEIPEYSGSPVDFAAAVARVGFDRCVGPAFTGDPLDTTGLTAVSPELAAIVDPGGRTVYSEDGMSPPYLIDTSNDAGATSSCEVSTGSSDLTETVVDIDALITAYEFWLQENTTNRNYYDIGCPTPPEANIIYHRATAQRAVSSMVQKGVQLTIAEGNPTPLFRTVDVDPSVPCEAVNQTPFW